MCASGLAARSDGSPWNDAASAAETPPQRQPLRLRRLPVVIAVAVLSCWTGPIDAQGSGPRRIVILHGTEIAIPGGLALERAIRETLSTRIADPVEFYSEALDVMRLGSDHEEELAAYLEKKYRSLRPDVLLLDNAAALAFVERHRERLWSDTPIVFSGIEQDTIGTRPFGPGITGVALTTDIAGTIDLAVRLQPRARRIVVVSGSSEYDVSWVPRVERALEPLRDRLEGTYLTGLSVDALVEAVRALPTDTIVLYTTVFRDAAGGTYVPREVVRRLAAASSAPVYGLFDTFIGHGIVGGSIASVDTQGRRAAEIAVRLLGGEPIAAIPVAPAPEPVRRIDWRQLVHWKLDGGPLPSDAVVQYRPSSFWWVYRYRIAVAAVALLAQTVLIVGLLAQGRRRRQAELEAERQRVALAHASRLALVGEITASIAHEINQPLGAILSNADAAEMLLDADPSRTDELRSILADIRKDDLRASDVIRHVRALLSKRRLEMRRIDLNAVVSESLSIVGAHAERRNTLLDTQLDAALPAVRGDRVHLQQVVLNLMLNGMEAMAQSPFAKRRLRISTARSADNSVELSVIDDGHGIPQERLPRLFDSFFSTKEDGMGLGLSIARSIVEAHGGRIWAESIPGNGATFRFTLPVDRS